MRWQDVPKGKDLNGRAYATVADTKPGDWLEVDDSFSCMETDCRYQVVEIQGGLGVSCDHGWHFLEGQLDDTRKYYIGLYHAERSE